MPEQIPMKIADDTIRQAITTLTRGTRLGVVDLIDVLESIAAGGSTAAQRGALASALVMNATIVRRRATRATPSSDA